MAERTKGATEEIGATISSIQLETSQTLEVMAHSRSAVEDGITQTAQARNSLNAMIEGSKLVDMQIHLIAAAATEQTAASGEISQSASRISQLTSSNSRSAEETAEACKNLSKLASDLDGIVHQFRMGDEIQNGAKVKYLPVYK